MKEHSPTFTAALPLAAILLGAAQAWSTRHQMQPDGISYLDMGDAYLRGDWRMAINAYWSPLYSWLLGLSLRVLRPAPFWEFSVVHLVNFVIYLLALASFRFFWRDWIRSRQESPVAGPPWAWSALGYMLFLWISLNLISLNLVNPDMCVAALVFLAAGILVRIRASSAGWPEFAFLGIILGFGYLAKAAMFPLALVFLATSAFAGGGARQAVPRALLATVAFFLIAGPFVVALSRSKGRFT